jgi:hypothetical protein
LVAPSLDSIVGVKVVVTLAGVVCSIGEASVRLARRAARSDMMTRLMEGIVMFVGVYGKASVFLYVVQCRVVNGRIS